jgi:hypothetical protein
MERMETAAAFNAADEAAPDVALAGLFQRNAAGRRSTLLDAP